MKKTLFLLILLTSLSVYAQSNFTKGYFIDTNNNKTECLIRNKDWGNTPEYISYKTNENSVEETINVADLKELKLEDTEHFYRRYPIESMDIQLNEDSKLFDVDFVFLKILVEGESSLYAYNNYGLYLFYEVDGKLKLINNDSNSNAIEKKYKKNFQKELYERLKCESLNVSDFTEANYREKDISLLFSSYNECINSKYTSYNDKRIKSKWYIKPVAGVVFSPSVKNYYEYLYSYGRAPSQGSGGNNNRRNERNFDFGAITNTAFGFELETLLPFKNNKWGLFISPTYQSISDLSANDSFNDEGLIDFTTDIEMSYSFVELPIGVRRYFYLNSDKFKIFGQVAYHQIIGLNSDITHNFDAQSSLLEDFSFELAGEESRVANNSGFSIGIGGTYNETLALVLNYRLINNVTLDSNNRLNNNGAVSLMVSYSL